MYVLLFSSLSCSRKGMPLLYMLKKSATLFALGFNKAGKFNYSMLINEKDAKELTNKQKKKGT